MTQSDAANIIQLCIVILVAVSFFIGVVPIYRLDAFRDELFCLRSELFDLAASGRVAFEDPAYNLLRIQINGFIRYGHQLTLYRLLLTFAARSISGPSREQSWNKEWESALSHITCEETRVKLAALHEKSLNAAVQRIFKGSPVLLLMVLCVGLFALLKGAVTSVAQLRAVVHEKVLHGPLDVRLIEDEAALSGI